MCLHLPVGTLNSRNRVVTLSFSPHLVLSDPCPQSTAQSSCHSSRPSSHRGRPAAGSHTSPASCTTPSTGHATGLPSARSALRRQLGNRPVRALGAAQEPPRPLQRGITKGGSAELRPADSDGADGAAQDVELPSAASQSTTLRVALSRKQREACGLKGVRGAGPSSQDGAQRMLGTCHNLMARGGSCRGQARLRLRSAQPLDSRLEDVAQASARCLFHL
jgi:hypothetical protein